MADPPIETETSRQTSTERCDAATSRQRYELYWMRLYVFMMDLARAVLIFMMSVVICLIIIECVPIMRHLIESVKKPFRQT